MSENIKFSSESGLLFEPSELQTITPRKTAYIRENIVEDLPFFNDESAVLQLSIF